MKNTTDATPACSTASTRPSAAASVSATGFSSSRCLPAWAACVAMGACTSGGTAKRDGVDLGQERGDVVLRGGLILGREVGRGLRVTAPDRGELDARR